jgi:hypothetical protein
MSDDEDKKGKSGGKDPNDFSFEDLELDELQSSDEGTSENHELPPLHPQFDAAAEKGLSAVYACSCTNFSGSWKSNYAG